MDFEVLKEDARTQARLGRMITAHGVVDTPVFMDVGTLGTVKALEPRDLVALKTQVVLGNTYHLMLRPGAEIPPVTVVQDRGSAIPLAADSRIAYLAYNATWKAPRHEGAVVNGLSGFDALSGVKRDGSTVLGNALAEAGADVFTLPEGATAEQLDSVITLTRDYDLVIVGVHDGSARPKKGLMSDETQIAMFDEWAASRRMIGIYFGSPYDMDNFRWHSECEAFIMAYADNEANEQAVAGLLTGEFKPKGCLPVSAGGYSPRSRR